MGNAAKKTKLVLENADGFVTRTIAADGIASGYVVFRQDSGRVEIVADLEDLTAQDIPYEVLSSFRTQDLKRSSLAVGSVGHLSLVEDASRWQADTTLADEDEKPFIMTLQWSTIGHIGLLGILFILSYFFGKSLDTLTEEEEPQLVQIVKPLPPPPKVRQVVKMSETKIKKQNIKNAKVTKRNQERKIVRDKTQKADPKSRTRIATHSRRSKNIDRSQNISMNELGALGVLGDPKANRGQKGGLNLGAAQTSAGIGLGGTGGSGGMQKHLYGKGIISAPLGAGNRADGGGGYGTNGRGGGRAGYGQASFIGSSSGYAQPLEQMAEVTGGLDRDQVDEVFRRNQGQILYCYEKGLQGNPRLRGTVGLDFRINANGRVSRAIVAHSSVGSNSVERCIVNKLKSWQFPRPVGGVTVSVERPIKLQRVGQG